MTSAFARLEALPIHVEAFGLFLALGLAVGLALTTRLADRSGGSREDGAQLLFAAGVGALLGARALYVLGSPERESLLQSVALFRGGLSGYGALLGAAAGAAWRARGGLQGSVRGWFDWSAPGAVLAAAIARLGCHLTGCDFGRPLSDAAPRWLERLGTVTRGSLESPAPVWLSQVASGRLGSDAPQSLPAHPVALYEAALLLLLLAALLWLRRVQRSAGQVAVLATLGYASVRALTEQWRADADRGVLPWLTVNVYCALASALLLAGWLLYTRAQRLRAE